jgi:selenoprotein W-related protein
MTHLKDRLGQLVLIPSTGGRFEISVDGKLVYSKLKTGRFPEFSEIKKHL